MHADICDPEDSEAIECFKTALKRLGAEKIDQSWGLGVDLLSLQIGTETLRVFSDTWSIDIEGPDQLVQNVLALFNQLKGENT